MFELFSDSAGNTEPILDLSGFCAAKLCLLNGATGRYEPSDQIIYVGDLFVNPGEWQGMAGLKGIGRKRVFQFNGKDAYDVVWMERPALLTTGKIQTGVPDNNGNYAIPDPASLFHYQQGEKPPPNRTRVYDPQAMFPYALGPGPFISSAQEPSAGGQFVATWDDRTSVLRLLIAQQQTFYCTGTLKENLERTAAIGRILDARTQMFSPFNLDPKDNNAINGLPFKNLFNLIGLAGDQCLLIWLENTQQWGLVAVDQSFHFGFVRPVEENKGNGELINAGFVNPAGIFVGSVFQAAPAIECVIRFQVMNGGVSDKKIVTVGKWYAGKLVGFQGNDPIYEAIATDQEWEGHATSNAAKGDNLSFTLHNADGSDSDVSVTANLRYRAYTKPKKARVKLDGDTLIANQAEC